MKCARFHFMRRRFPDAGLGSPACASRLGWGVVLFVLCLQFWSRYLPSPGTVLVADDWANLARSSFHASYSEAARDGLQDSNRPFSMMAVNVVFRLFGDKALYWTLLSLAANSLLVFAILKMAFELTGRRWVAATTGAIFALLPNLTETYHFSTQVVNEVSCALVFYAVSGWTWVAHVRRGGAWRLALSVLAYGVALFSYEAGIFLPAAYVTLLPWKKAPGKSAGCLVPFAAAGLLYLAWRATHAFGLNPPAHYPSHMQAGLSLGGIAVNAWQLLHWWAGEYLFGAMLSGFQSFANLPPWTRRFLVLANVAVVVLIGRVLRRLAGPQAHGGAPPAFSGTQVAGFALAWTGAAWALIALSYTGGRLNVIPAIGISLLAALLLERRAIRQWGPVLFLPAMLALVANQGTSESYRQAGQLDRRICAFLQKTAAEWRDKEILLFDTRALRQRLTPGLLKPVGEDQDTWALYRNALLIRGFVPFSMVQLAVRQEIPGIQVLHDVEHGARIEGDRLIWHARYDFSRPQTNSMADVFVVDCFDVGKDGQ